MTSLTPDRIEDVLQWLGVCERHYAQTDALVTAAKFAQASRLITELKEVREALGRIKSVTFRGDISLAERIATIEKIAALTPVSEGDEM